MFDMVLIYLFASSVCLLHCVWRAESERGQQQKRGQGKAEKRRAPRSNKVPGNHNTSRIVNLELGLLLFAGLQVFRSAAAAAAAEQSIT